MFIVASSMVLAKGIMSYCPPFFRKETPKFCSDDQMKYPPNKQDNAKYKIVDTLLDKGRANVHADYGRSLQLAVDEGDAPMVELLVRKYGADPGMMSHLAVIRAVHHGNVEVVKLLLDNYDMSGYLKPRMPLPPTGSSIFFCGNGSPSLPFDKTRESSVFEQRYGDSDVLLEAARSDVPEMMSLLVDEYLVGKDDPERLRRALEAAAKFGKLNTVSWLARRLKDDHGAEVPIETLRTAASFGQDEVVDLLCSEFGADAHAEGGILLKSAAQHVSRRVVDLLCSKFGVDAISHNNSALRSFAAFGDAVMVDKLVRDYGAQGDDACALENAAMQGYLSVVRLLMTEHGATPPPLENDKDNDPLSYAARVAEKALPKLEAYVEMPPPGGFTYFVTEACERRDRLRKILVLHEAQKIEQKEVL